MRMIYEAEVGGLGRDDVLVSESNRINLEEPDALIGERRLISERW